MRSVFYITWGDRAPNPEEDMVLRNVAVLFLKRKRKNKNEKDTVHFKHDICEGMITYKGEGLYGSVGGTFFRADLGSVRGQIGIVDFFLPRGTENIKIDEDSIVFVTRGKSFRGADTKKERVSEKPQAIDPSAFIAPESPTFH